MNVLEVQERLGRSRVDNSTFRQPVDVGQKGNFCEFCSLRGNYPPHACGHGQAVRWEFGISTAFCCAVRGKSLATSHTSLERSGCPMATGKVKWFNDQKGF